MGFEAPAENRLKTIEIRDEKIKDYHIDTARVRDLCAMPLAWLMKVGRKRTRYGEMRKLGTTSACGRGLQPLAEFEYQDCVKKKKRDSPTDSFTFNSP